MSGMASVTDRAEVFMASVTINLFILKKNYDN